LVGVLGVGGGAQHPLHRGDLVGVGAHVDGAGGAIGAEQRRGDREADQRGLVQLGGQGDRVQDAEDGEPAAPYPHLAAPAGDARLAGGAGVDAAVGGGGGAEYGGRIAGGGRIQPGALGDGGADRLGELEVGGGHTQPAGLRRWDVVVAVDRGVADGGDRGGLLDRADAADHPDGFLGQDGGVA